MDVQRLQESFTRMTMHGDAVPLFFYSDLFLRHPETRDLFPVSMAAQRDRLVHALGRIVSDAGHVDALGEYLQDLGREHRKFGAIAEYYPYVGASLVATLAHFNGPAWTPAVVLVPIPGPAAVAGGTMIRAAPLSRRPPPARTQPPKYGT